MKLLDLFCCEGGAGEGYRRAGFDVTGVDINPQPRNPHRFILADALEYVREHGHEYDAIHASPPCQRYSCMTPKANKADHPDLLPQITEFLRNFGKPYCVENVAGAKRMLRNPIMLCGSMFGLPVFRHRFFEVSTFFITPDCRHDFTSVMVTMAGKYSCAARPLVDGIKRKSVKYAPLAYGIDWMDYQGLREAIPPAYTEFIGRQLLAVR
jgi:DNA (cytosine-5)-methyltransferase 1